MNKVQFPIMILIVMGTLCHGQLTTWIILRVLYSKTTQLITSIVTFVGVLWMMLTISWQLTLIALATVPLSLIVVMVVAPRSQKHFAAQQKA